MIDLDEFPSPPGNFWAPHKTQENVLFFSPNSDYYCVVFHLFPVSFWLAVCLPYIGGWCDNWVCVENMIALQKDPTGGIQRVKPRQKLNSAWEIWGGSLCAYWCCIQTVVEGYAPRRRVGEDPLQWCSHVTDHCFKVFSMQDTERQSLPVYLQHNLKHMHVTYDWPIAQAFNI